MHALLSQLRKTVSVWWISVLALALPMAGFAADAAPAQLNNGLTETATAAYGNLPSSSLPIVIGQVIKSALSLVGVLFLVLIIYGGFLWMTAAGNQQTADKAKSIITSAVIGMVIIAAGYAITSFVMGRIGDATGIVSATTTP